MVMPASTWKRISSVPGSGRVRNIQRRADSRQQTLQTGAERAGVDKAHRCGRRGKLRTASGDLAQGRLIVGSGECCVACDRTGEEIHRLRRAGGKVLQEVLHVLLTGAAFERDGDLVDARRILQRQ